MVANHVAAASSRRKTWQLLHTPSGGWKPPLPSKPGKDHSRHERPKATEERSILVHDPAGFDIYVDADAGDSISRSLRWMLLATRVTGWQGGTQYRSGRMSPSRKSSSILWR